ncbi:MAG: GGDEF domain-containing protein [Planctomycetaceae bacterium]
MAAPAPDPAPDPARPRRNRTARRGPSGLRRPPADDADPLTGLASRRRLERALTRLLATRRGEHAEAAPRGACVLVDVVGLKGVNHDRGYSAGDRLLVEAAARLRCVAPTARIVARLGGDEFVALFTGPRAASEAAEACRQAAAGLPRLRAGWEAIHPGSGPASLFDRLHAACRGAR